MALSALLTACPGLPAPEEIDFEGDPSILRGAWTGKVGGVMSLDVASLAFSPDGKFFALTALDNVLLYDADTLTSFRRLPLENTYVDLLAFNADGSTLATSGNNVSFWDASTGERLRTLKAVEEVRVFSKDLTLGVTVKDAYQRVTVKVWNLTTETVLNTFEVTADAVADAHSVHVYSLALSPDGTTLAVANTISKIDGNHVSKLRLWNVKTGALEKTFQPRSDSCSSIGSVAFSPDGESVAFNECGGIFSLVDVASGRLLPVSKEIEVANSFAFHPDSAQLIVKSQRGDAAGDPVTLELWDLGEGLLRTSESGEINGGSGLFAFSTDGSRLAVSNAYGTVSVLNVSDFNALAMLPKVAPFGISLALEASYIDERSYTVTGTLTTEAGNYKLTGTANSGTGHRYIKPAHAAPSPQSFQASVFDADGTLHWTLDASLLHDDILYTGSVRDVSAQATGFGQLFSIERP